MKNLNTIQYNEDLTIKAHTEQPIYAFAKQQNTIRVLAPVSDVAVAFAHFEALKGGITNPKMTKPERLAMLPVGDVVEDGITYKAYEVIVGGALLSNLNASASDELRMVSGFWRIEDTEYIVDGDTRRMIGIQWFNDDDPGAVATELDVAYPSASAGDTVRVMDTNSDWYYDGDDWVDTEDQMQMFIEDLRTTHRNWEVRIGVSTELPSYKPTNTEYILQELNKKIDATAVSGEHYTQDQTDAKFVTQATYDTKVTEIEGRITVNEDDIVDLQNDKLNRDGTQTMLGDIDMNNNDIENVKNITTDELVLDGEDLQGLLDAKVAKNIAITPDTKTKITYDAKGLVTAGANLAATDIPDLDADKVTSGTLHADRIPSLDADKTTSGVFADARIPDLNASKITEGTLHADRIPNLDADKIATGTVNIARLPAAALERLIIVDNEAARFDLTTTTVQVGDTVLQEDTNIMYRVVDDAQLNVAAGYKKYVAGRAAAVDWSGVEETPTTLEGYGITDAADDDHNHDETYEPKNDNIQNHIEDTTGNPHSVDESKFEGDGEAGIKPKSEKTVDVSHIANIPTAQPTGEGQTDGYMSHQDKLRLDDIEDEAEVNVLEGVVVDGTTLTVDGDKNVTIPVANDGEGTESDGLLTHEEKTKLTNIAAEAQVNVIEEIKVDDAVQTPTDKSVNIDLSGKVDKVEGKALSTNDYDDNELAHVGFTKNITSAGRLFGGVVTEGNVEAATDAATVNVSAGEGIIKNESATPEDEPTTATDGQGSALTKASWESTEVALTPNAYNFIYYDGTAGEMKSTTNFYAIDFTRDFTVGRTFYTRSGSEGEYTHEIIIRLCGTNAWNFNRRVQLFGEEVFPIIRAQNVGGLLIADEGSRQFSSTSGVLWAELVNRFTVDGIDTSGTDTFTGWYGSTTEGWTSANDLSTVPTQYNDGTTVQNLSNNRYGVHWVYVLHDSTFHVVYGTLNTQSLGIAQSELPPQDIPEKLAAYATLLGRFIVRDNQADFIEVQSALTQPFSLKPVTNHNDLSGLQGGTVGEYNHLTNALLTKLTDLDVDLLPQVKTLVAFQAEAPGSASDGDIYYNTTYNKLWTWDDDAWGDERNPESGIFYIWNHDTYVWDSTELTSITDIDLSDYIKTVNGETPDVNGAVTVPNAVPTGEGEADGTMTHEDKAKLDGIEAEADANVNADWDATEGDAEILNKPGNAVPTGEGEADGLMSHEDKAKLDGVEEGADANVNADWDATTGDAEILNKPTIPSSITDLDGTANKVLYVDNEGDMTELSLGADGEYLKSNGAAVAPSFATPTDTTYENAVPTGAGEADGLMSHEDKAKLDGVEEGAKAAGETGDTHAGTAHAPSDAVAAGETGDTHAGTAHAPSDAVAAGETGDAHAGTTHAPVHYASQLKNTAYTLGDGDENTLILAGHAENAVKITIPTHATHAFAKDTEIAIVKYLAGDVTIGTASGATLNGEDHTTEFELADKYDSVALKKIDDNTWIMVGKIDEVV